jgi:hypothetical protein
MRRWRAETGDVMNSIRSRVVPRALHRLKDMHPEDFRALFDEEWERETQGASP